MSKGSVLITVVLVALLGAAVWLMIAGSNLGSDVQLSNQAIFAMILGIVLSLIVGCGLMFLVFFSSRRGFDETARLMRKDEE